MGRSVAGLLLTLLLIVLLNVWREGQASTGNGGYAVRSWFPAKFLNRPLPRPDLDRRARRGGRRG